MKYTETVESSPMHGFRKPTFKHRLLTSVLAVALIQPWGLIGNVYAAYVEETATVLPIDNADSYSLAAADVNGDGTNDLFVANRGQSRLLVSDGLGGYADETAARLPAALYTTLDAAFADIDGVNGVDLILVGDGQNRIFMNDGTGVFTDDTGARLPAETDTSLAVAAGDLDGDTDIDLVIANRANSNQILINNGTGVFTDESASRLAPDADFTYGIALGDSNNDGALDIFFANFSGQNRLHLNDFLGVFTDVTNTNVPTAVGGSGDAEFLDVDADGDQDLIIADGPTGVSLLINNGTGTFTDAPGAQTPALNTFAVKVNVEDINFDGSPDVLVSAMGQDNVLLNDGTGTLVDATAVEVPADTRRSFGAELVDADGDLDLDWVAATPQGQNRYYENAIEAPRVQLSVSPDYIEVTDTVTIDVSAFDEDGVALLDVVIIQPDTSTATPTDTGGGIYTFVPAQIGLHTVQVTAEDTLANSVVRTLTFLAQANDITAPVVNTLNISDNPITQGESTTFSVTATDDRGVITLALTVDGVNVPLNAAGQATYAPPNAGTLAVVATATDAAGNEGQASDTLQVDADVTAPVVTLNASPDPVDITNPIAVAATATDNVSVASLTVTVTGPAGGPVDEPVTLDGAGNGTYTPFLPGTYTFEATAADPAGNTTVQTATVEAQGIPDNEDPVVNLSVVPGATVPGGTVTITVDATDNVFVASRTLDVNGTPLTLDGNNQATFSPPSLGAYTATATATDPSGNTGTDMVVFNAVDPATDTDAPIVDITAPAEGGDIAGVVTFTGTATDLTLVSYELSYRASGSGNAFTPFFTGSAVVENGALGDLDTTVLENGLVDIQLTATDINGLISSTVRVYSADGGFKPGVFTITYEDLNVPVAGIPITVYRDYDSRRRGASGDFGNGWDLRVVQEGTYTNNRPLGENWTVLGTGGFLNQPCGSAREDSYHITEIRFSDTEFYKFATVPVVDVGFGISGGCPGTVSFSQVGGVPGATLEILGSSNAIFFLTSSGYITYDLGSPEFGLVWNPQQVRLTTLDGREYDLDLAQGLQRIGDSNGNSLFFAANSVTHSSGVGITYVRDGAGRITSITDPLGQTQTYAYNAAGNLETHTDRGSNVTTFTYDGSNFLTRIDDPLGNTPIRNEYDADGRLIAQTDADGNRTLFDSDPNAGTETVTQQDGTVTLLQYDQAGNLTSGSVGAATKTYTYDANGNRLTETDANGNTTTFTYDANDQMLSETDALGNAMTYSYTANGRPLQVVDPSGAELNFTYDANGNVTEQRDANGNLVQGFSINAAGDPSQITTAAGVTDIAYDTTGNITQIVKPNGAVETFTYDALGRRLTASVERTSGGTTSTETTSYTYDANDNLLTVTDPLGGVTTYAYDAKNRRISETDALGNVTTFAYDDRGNLTRTDYEDGTFEIRGYDLRGRTTAITDRGGRTRFFDYDANDYLTRVIYEDGSSITSTYDGAGNRLTQTDAAGNTTTWTYDNINRVLTWTDATGATRSQTYTGNLSRPTTVTDARGNTTTYTYDTSMLFTENLLQTTHPDTEIRSQTWGANARVTSKTDENGNTTTFTYDGAANLTQVTDALGNVTSYTYDELGNRLSQTDANGNTTTFTYDANGNRLSKTLPGGQTETWTYDAVGNMLVHTNLNGDVLTHEYDSNNRLIRRIYPDASEETFTYTATGMPASVTDATGSASFTYDARDRLVTATAPDGSSITYAYDAVGNRTQVASTAGDVDYAYDPANRIATVTDRDNGETTYGYDANGNLTSIDYPNGTSATMVYDTRNRTVRVTHLGPGGAPVLADYQYSLDAVGNRLQVIEAAGRTLDFSYDAINRLTQVIEDPAGAALTTGYTYDDAGNLLTIALPGSTLTATYDINDRLLTVDGRVFAYDNAGNLLSITEGVDVTTFAYDELNRLVSRTEPSGVTTTFEYNAMGHRVARVVDGVRTEYTVDMIDPSGVAQVIEERDGGGALQATYARGAGIVRMERGATSSYFHADALGSVRALTDDLGNVTDTYDYDAYGDQVASTGATQNEYGFAGERSDPSTGLQYLRARYYDPEIARFISRDPHPGNPQLPLTLNPYQYGLNNPVNHIDPTGEFSLVSVSISVAIVGVLATIAYNTILKPAKDVYDKVEELIVGIPNGVLNKEGTRETLGLTVDSITSAIQEEDITNVVNLGGGMVEKSYGIVYGMSTTMGKVVALIHANNAATWLGYLPEHNNIPGNYVSCGFNTYLQKTYALGWVTGLAAAKRFQAASNIIAAYLAYFNFLALVGSTVSDTRAEPQPVEDADFGLTACSQGEGS